MQATKHLQPSSEVTGPAAPVLELLRIPAVTEGRGGRLGAEERRDLTQDLPGSPLANKEERMVRRAEAREQGGGTCYRVKREWRRG